MNMAYNADTKLGDLLDNPVTKEVLFKFLPEMKTAGPMLNMGRGMSLKTVASFPQAKITPETLQAIVDELSKL
jgi:hypothetical protein